jgi:hypothetical protein
MSAPDLDAIRARAEAILRLYEAKDGWIESPPGDLARVLATEMLALLALVEQQRQALVAVALEAERIADVRVNRTRVIGNIHLIAHDALAEARE